jgi:elongation factor 2
MPKLWGDNFFNPKTKKFIKESTSEEGDILKRAFA